MIRSVFYRETGTIVEFTVDGHAGWGDYGDDIVCAAVSALAQSALIGIEEVLQLPAIVKIDDDTGHLACRLPAVMPPEQRYAATVLLETLLRSLRSVEAGYPDHVHIREVHR